MKIKKYLLAITILVGLTPLGLHAQTTNGIFTGYLSVGNFNTYIGSSGSMAVGAYNTPSGAYSVATGYGSTGTGGESVGMGSFTTAYGNYSVALGQATWAIGNKSTALGSFTIANGPYSTAMGSSTTANSYNSFAAGSLNLTNNYTGTTNWISTDPLFELGNSTNSAARSDAYIVYKNGNSWTQGTVNAHVAVRTNASGDISMGSFTAGTAP